MRRKCGDFVTHALSFGLGMAFAKWLERYIQRPTQHTPDTATSDALKMAERYRRERDHSAE